MRVWSRNTGRASSPNKKDQEHQHQSKNQAVPPAVITATRKKIQAY